MNRIFCLMLLLCPYGSYCQQQQPVDIGGKAPSMIVSEVYNRPLKKYRIKPVPHRIQLIHFLSTTCTSCIASVQQYKPLKDRFGDSLQVLFVTAEPQAKLDKFLQKHPRYFGNLPVAYGNRQLSTFFPFEFISHLVWINDQGKAVAFTGTQYLTEENVSMVLRGDMPAWPVKRDFTAFQKERPILKTDDGHIPYSSIPAHTLYSAFYSHMPDLPTGFYSTPANSEGYLKKTLINQSMVALYRSVFKLTALPSSHVLINDSSQLHYVYDKAQFFKAGWDLYNSFCYEILYKKEMSDAAIREKMLLDLGFYLGVEGSYRDTVLNCYVLTNVSPTTNKAVDTVGGLKLRHILYNLNNKYGSPPVLDARTQNDDALVIPGALPLLSDMPALQKQLALFGYELRLQPQQIKALILTRKTASTFSHSPKLYMK